MPQTPTRHPADSWPPTQLRLDPAAIEDTSALTYFLTPAQYASTDLSAGIETPKKTALSTASLFFARQYEERREEGERGSPPLLSDPSSESDDEDYVRFPPGGLEVRRYPDDTPRAARKAGDKAGKRGFSKKAPLPSQNRGRAPRRDGAKRAWREPSPYVWSIDEEREDGGSARGRGDRRKSVGGRGKAVVVQEEPVDEKAIEERLSRRKVRFVLPVKE